MSERRMHDMGGSPAGAIDRHEHEPTLVERRIDAMMMLLRDQPRSLWKTDENRRTIENLPPDLYESGAYYQPWVEAPPGREGGADRRRDRRPSRRGPRPPSRRQG